MIMMEMQDRVAITAFVVDGLADHAQLSRADRRDARKLARNPLRLAAFLAIHAEEIEAQAIIPEAVAAFRTTGQPAFGDGTFFDKLVSWIADGGLEKLFEFIMQVIGLFSSFALLSRANVTENPDLPTSRYVGTGTPRTTLDSRTDSLPEIPG